MNEAHSHQSDLPRPIPWLDPKSGLASFDGVANSRNPSGSAESVPAPAKKRVHLPLVQASKAQASRAQASAAASKPQKRGFFAKIFRAKPRPGSGLPPRKVITALVWARRASQTFFFLLFLRLLTETTLRDPGLFRAQSQVRLPHTVEAFLLFDPFVALITVLSTHRLYAGLIWSLSIVVLTLVLGRVFCGWICPMGTLQHLLGFLWPSSSLKGKSRVELNRPTRWQSVKYGLLSFFSFAALTGTVIGGLFDPICALFRGIALGVLPALQYIGIRTLSSDTLQKTKLSQRASGEALDFLGQNVWTEGQSYYHQTWLVLGVFAAFVLAARFIPRFFCRVLCPLGALLGVLSRFSLFGMVKSHEKCTDCNLCVSHCQGADAPEGGVKHKAEECHVCFNCEAACPEDVIRFQFFPGLRSRSAEPDLTRRATLTTAAAGALLVPSMRIANWPDKGYAPNVIRPPGALPEHEFLESCIRCAECMKVCPNNALHPAFFEAGPEGLWTPILIPRIGYCEHSCVLCGQVCPTGAIQKIEEKHKLGQGVPPIRIGTAMFDRGRCLPWAMATPCTVCEEFCPTSPKAIWTEEVFVPRRVAAAEVARDSVEEQVRVKRPHVDPALCIGCGACEKVCPVVDKPAVYVTSAGESRSKTNVILLEDTAYGAG